MVKADIKDLERELWLRRRDSWQLVWQTRDGHEIAVKDMSDTHIENAIKHAQKVQERIDAFEDVYCGLMDKDWFF